MSVKVQQYRVDDLAAAKRPGAEVPADRTLRFAFDGKEWEIDLSDTNAVKLRKKLEPYMAAGRRIKGRHRSRPVSERRRSAEIREWARARGHKISNRGRIPAQVIAEFERVRGFQAA